MTPPAPTQDEMLLHMLSEIRDIMADISKQAMDISLATGHLKKLFDQLIERVQQDEEAGA